MAMLERRCIFQTISIYVRFRGVVFVKFSFMSSTFSCLPPTKFKSLQLSIVKKPSTKLISDNCWGRFCRRRRSRASFFWYFLSQTLRTRRECGKANLPVAFLRNAGWTWLWYWCVKWIQMTFYLKNLWRRKKIYYHRTKKIKRPFDLWLVPLWSLRDFLRVWMWGTPP